MVRATGGVVAGLVAWMVFVTLFNLGLRHGWPAYATVEKSMLFTLPMMAARLSISALASLASGAVAARVGRTQWAPILAGLVLLALFAPVHYGLWNRFPLWYHLTFLTSLPLVSWLGGQFVRSRPALA